MSGTQPFHLYRCVVCHHGLLGDPDVVDGCGTVRCDACRASYLVEHHIVDTLVSPSPAVVEELRGLAAERDMPKDRWADVKIRREDRVPTLEDRLERSAGDAVQYYQQTTSSYQQARALLCSASPGPRRVLEVGAEAPYYFLESFRERGSECFALNVLYFYEEPDAFATWPYKALGDMNDLPYQDQTFDLVVLSATAHHSSDLGPLFSETSRVLVPGGRALVVNEPVEGLVKSLGRRRRDHHHHRDEHIHEGAYRIWHYTSAMRAAGFEWLSYFPDFFDEKLLTADLHPDTRFAGVARAVSRVWGWDPLRRFAKARLLWPAQATIGFPFNAVLTKPPAPS